MTNGTGPVSGWDNQNAVTNDSVVADNMDRMARALADKPDRTEAWQTIFQKPPGKEWNQTVVAIKTNCIAVQRTRNAVMKKTCEVLVDHLGVSPANIHIYDACHGAGMPAWTGLPTGVQVENRWGGYPTKTPLPPPLPGGSLGDCQTDVATGGVDILVNTALCKGHSSSFGTFTMCAKNHYGTFRPGCSSGYNNTDYLFSINKSEAILGAMDPGTGRIVYPRQQLCFIDALWASQGGPSGEPTHRPNRLYMGTFAPILDYQVATKFRRDIMGWSISGSVTPRFLSEFGYAPTEIDPVAIVDARKWTPDAMAVAHWKQY
jgi:hypothetical protein